MSYATLTDARSEGITPAMADDARLTALLTQASQFIDTYTEQWFEPRTETLRFDGHDGELLHLPVPILALTSVTLDGAALSLTEDVIAYKSLRDRSNPKLARAGSGVWCVGRQNIVVVGSFGYCEADGTSPPPEIQRATLLLVVRNLAQLADPAAADARRAGEVFKEVTDGHSYELGGNFAGAAGSWRRNGLTGDPEIDRVLMRYRRPIAGGVV